MSENERASVPVAAAWLGALGAIPFVGLAGLSWLRSEIGIMAPPALLAYGAVILSFLGGVHWGLAMSRNPNWSVLGMSVAPSLVGWAALLTSTRVGLWVLAAAFVAMLLVDLTLARRGLTPAWYPRLRVPLSTVVVLSLVAAALAL